MAGPTTRKRASLFAVLVLIAVAAATLALLLPNSGPRPAPETEFLLLDGKKLALAGLRGRPVLVSFWATTCRPCLEELPDLIRFYSALRPRGFELVAVAMPYDPPHLVQSFRARHNIPYPVALDIEGRVTRAFDGVPYIPAAFLIAPDGRIAYRQTGKLDIEKARRIIESHLPSPATQPSR